jgi:hypothetical protein
MKRWEPAVALLIFAAACSGKSNYVGGYCAENASVRMIDDMEGGDWRFASPGIEGYWQCAWDASNGAKGPEACQSSHNQGLAPAHVGVESPPRTGSEYARRAKGDSSTGWGASIGFDFNNRRGFDASPWTGVRFYARSNTQGGDRVRMHIPDWNTSPQGSCQADAEGNGCDRNFGIELVETMSDGTTVNKVAAEWTPYDVYWADLKQPSKETIQGETRAALATTKIIGIRFQIDGTGETGGGTIPAYDFWIDDVSFLCDVRSSP